MYNIHFYKFLCWLFKLKSHSSYMRTIGNNYGPRKFKTAVMSLCRATFAGTQRKLKATLHKHQRETKTL